MKGATKEYRRDKERIAYRLDIYDKNTEEFVCSYHTYTEEEAFFMYRFLYANLNRVWVKEGWLAFEPTYEVVNLEEERMILEAEKEAEKEAELELEREKEIAESLKEINAITGNQSSQIIDRVIKASAKNARTKKEKEEKLKAIAKLLQDLI